MKKTFIAIVGACLAMTAAAQSVDSTRVENDTTQQNTRYYCGHAEVVPQFPGGDEAMLEFLTKNVKYPELAAEYGVEGRVVMQFFVETDGKISNISATNCMIERFITTKFSQETEAKQKQLKEQFALLFAKEGARVIRKMPKWTPALQGEKKIRTKYSLPIRFKIPDK